MITPVARSTTLPLMANSLNSLIAVLERLRKPLPTFR